MSTKTYGVKKKGKLDLPGLGVKGIDVPAGSKVRMGKKLQARFTEDRPQIGPGERTIRLGNVGERGAGRGPRKEAKKGFLHPGGGRKAYK